MTEAETILTMIETVDPADTAKLDEIDGRVWCWRSGFEFYEIDNDYIEFHHPGNNEGSVHLLDNLRNLRVTRSRDALKAIRPQYIEKLRYVVNIEKYFQGWTCQFGVLLSPPLATEELAELHAIIQAIEYERREKATMVD